MIERIEYDGTLLAMIIRAEYSSDGIEFFTPPEFSQQLAYMNRPKGHVVDSHEHNLVPREVSLTQEVLIMRSGRVRVDFFDNDRNYLESRELGSGDVILLASGGHGLTMLEQSELIEVKQGPFAGDDDKVRFDGIDEETVRMRGLVRGEDG